MRGAVQGGARSRSGAMTCKFPIVATCAFALLVAVAPMRSAMADASPDLGGASNADHATLRSQWQSLHDELDNLHKTIDNYSKEISDLSDPKATHEKVAGLQASISEALAQTAENGTITLLMQKVIDTEKNWKADIYRHDWPRSRVDFLERQFDASIGKTETAIAAISDIRKELTSTLKRIQSDDDYLEALAHVQQSDEMTHVLQDLLRDLRATSDNLSKIADGVPGV
jgi:predicted  nucleic acid-binding Zn-ribbon protein